MVYEFRLPDIGEGVAEGEIVKWHVKEGDEVKENQTLVEIMTDKVNVEIPSPRKGTIQKRMAREGEVIKVGQVLIVIADADSAVVSASTVMPDINIPKPTKPELRHQETPLEPIQTVQTREVLATPATRKLARDLGVDLSMVQGTGRGGRITDEDLYRFKGASAPAEVTVPLAGVHRVEERVPLRGIRRIVAQHMAKSKSTAAQVTHVDEVDVTEMILLREKTKASTEKRGVKLTYLPFIIKALIPALKEYPYLNASLDDEKEEIILRKYYNIGIATDTDQGLLVPVIKDAELKSITQLAAEISTLSDKARAGRLTLDEIQGSTFTITNVGSIGGMFSTPIINYPEVAILGVQKITKRPVAKDNKVVIRDMMYVSLSFDHRVLDGAMAAHFVNAIKRYLEDPKFLLPETD